MFTYFY